VRTLLEHGLVDELRLMLFPVGLGSGKRLFGETPAAFTVVSAEPSAQVVLLRLLAAGRAR
jgi:dihydrofolate reductase